jgi:predicted thioesterase
VGLIGDFLAGAVADFADACVECVTEFLEAGGATLGAEAPGETIVGAELGLRVELESSSESEYGLCTKTRIRAYVRSIQGLFIGRLRRIEMGILTGASAPNMHRRQTDN